MKKVIIICLLWCSVFLLTCKTGEQYSAEEIAAAIAQAKGINTETDPAYTGINYNSYLVPPDGTCMLVIGQDKETIIEYVEDQDAVPSGFMFYTSIQHVDGLMEPTDYGAGIAHADYILENYNNVIAQIGVYMVYALSDVITGKHDRHIECLAKWIIDFNNPVYLRIGYEFDGPHNTYEPELYVQAYQYIVDKLRNYGVSNIAYVWHSYAAEPYRYYAIDKWYPGDDYVDWFAVSAFGQMYNLPNKYTDAIIEMARAHRKPVMIAEASPFGGIKPGIETWNNWFVPTFNFIYKYNIKMFCYINADWDSQEMWKDNKTF